MTPLFSSAQHAKRGQENSSNASTGMRKDSVFWYVKACVLYTRSTQETCSVLHLGFFKTGSV